MSDKRAAVHHEWHVGEGKISLLCKRSCDMISVRGTDWGRGGGIFRVWRKS